MRGNFFIRNVYCGVPTLHYLCYSDYHVRIGETAANARREKKDAQEDAQTNEMNEEMIDA
ncbi:MAG: hypothetical protein GXY77_20240 [Fibrobacter sp.]|nr:hypothetical protein [Fibrobacter sp.]